MEFEYRYDIYHLHPSDYSDQCTSRDIFTPTNLSRQSTMQRYLQESDRPLFNSAPHESNDISTQAYPSVPYGNQERMSNCTHDGWQSTAGYGSPVESTLDSTYNSSGWSDRTSSPWLSPQINNIRPVERQPYGEWAPHGFGGHTPMPRHDSVVAGSCVAMHDVQPQADAQLEVVNFGDERFGYASYGAFVHEGYQPIEPGDDHDAPESYPDVIDTDFDAPNTSNQSRATEHPATSSRRTSRPTPVTSPASPTRVTRRPRARRTTSRRNAQDLEDEHHASFSTPSGAFPCPLAIYGCSSSFGSKNEWKRHVASQHMRLGFWKCDQCLAVGKQNDFNRKDLYIQHVRRMHPIETAPQIASISRRGDHQLPRDSPEDMFLQDASVRCYRKLRSAPEHSCCLFCEENFHGEGSWDERMGHIGRHLELMKKEQQNTDTADWNDDHDVREWLEKQGLIVARGQGWVLADGGRRKSAA